MMSLQTDPRVVQGHLALTATQVGFALFPVVGIMAFGSGGVSPLGLGAWRIAGGTLVLGALSVGRYGRRAFPARRDIPMVFAAALLGVGVNQGLFLEGLSRSTPMHAGLVMSLIPVFTFAIAAATRLEALSWLRGAGIVIALAGTLPLLLESGIHSLGAYGLGNLLMVANALSYSGYLAISKVLTRRYPPLALAWWAYAFSLVALPVFLWRQDVIPASATVWGALAYTIAVPTVLGYLLNTFALARLRASTAAAYTYAQPLLTGLASWLVFSERPTARILVAAPSIFVGLWLVGRRPPPVGRLPAAPA